jgi:hypothetical protein
MYSQNFEILNFKDMRQTSASDSFLCYFSKTNSWTIRVSENLLKRFSKFSKFENTFLEMRQKTFTLGTGCYIFQRNNIQRKISSGVDNWYLDDYFEEFICGR